MSNHDAAGEIVRASECFEHVGPNLQPWRSASTQSRAMNMRGSWKQPTSFLSVEVDDYSRLLLLDGRVGDERRRRGVPHVLEVNLDRRSKFGPQELPRLLHQVVNFARINWRGFNAQAIPATLNYSHLIARLVAEIGADRWSPIASAGRLRDKAWFL